MTNDLIVVLAGALGSTAWFWYDKKKSDKELLALKTKSALDHEKFQQELKDITVKMVEHTNIHITEERSRQIAEEICGRMEKDVTETKSMVQTLMNQVNSVASALQTQTAVKIALDENAKKDQQRSNNLRQRSTD